MEVPKLFISYSWSSNTHEQWVLSLAHELRESGVDVILDKWDLKEGQDSYAFMEKMVTDKNIKKVAIICDETYANKADGRMGGVGTETQIISKEVYENQDQNKFVAIVSSKDELGKPYLPTYYKSRIYIDLSEADKYSENFEKLLRWIYDKPLYIKPELGKPPGFLDDNAIALGTTAAFKRAIDAIKNQRSNSFGILDEYLGTFVANLERFRIDSSGEFDDDKFLKNIEEFIPYRNEAIQLFVTISQYSPEIVYVNKIHRFFEQLIPYTSRPQNVSQWRETDFDNFKFITHELFLYWIAILLRYEQFELTDLMLEQKYYVPENADYGKKVMRNFSVFRSYLKTLEYRNSRLGSRRLSLRADLLNERNQGSGIDFRYLMQADFILYLRAELQTGDRLTRWWPETLLYLGHFHSAFEIFARAVSLKYFDRAKNALGIQSKEDLAELLESFRSGERKLPRWEFESFDPYLLLGFDDLATSL